MIELKPFNTIAFEEHDAITELFMKEGLWEAHLSGYLAGRERGGPWVRALEDEWASTFKVKHAIACNSATSGLMAAAFAIGLQPGDTFVCPALTMSATAAAPMFTGATPIFVDVEDETFSISSCDLPYSTPAFVTNLFGHPADLRRLRAWCDLNKTFLVEDNAQSPFAFERDKYAGTIGHIGVFSLNVHKPIQCGEGGVIVTDDDDLATRMRNFINHGENNGDGIGLNLRMPELCAAVALIQLRKGEEIVQTRIAQAEAIIAAASNAPNIRAPITRFGFRHVYYAIPFLVDGNRTWLCNTLRARGVPIVEGYVPPLYRLKAFSAFQRDCPVAERLHDRDLFYFENCAWDVSLDQAEQIGEIIHQTMRELA